MDIVKMSIAASPLPVLSAADLAELVITGTGIPKPPTPLPPIHIRPGHTILSLPYLNNEDNSPETVHLRKSQSLPGAWKVREEDLASLSPCPDVSEEDILFPGSPVDQLSPPITPAMMQPGLNNPSSQTCDGDCSEPTAVDASPGRRQRSNKSSMPSSTTSRGHTDSQSLGTLAAVRDALKIDIKGMHMTPKPSSATYRVNSNAGSVHSFGSESGSLPSPAASVTSECSHGSRPTSASSMASWKPDASRSTSLSSMHASVCMVLDAPLGGGAEPEDQAVAWNTASYTKNHAHRASRKSGNHGDADTRTISEVERANMPSKYLQNIVPTAGKDVLTAQSHPHSAVDVHLTTQPHPQSAMAVHLTAQPHPQSGKRVLTSVTRKPGYDIRRRH